MKSTMLLLFLCAAASAGAAESAKGGNMNKILIAYAGSYGSTAEVAEFIAITLRENGAAVTVAPAKTIKEISGYNSVIVGSAIHAGKWLGDATKFLKKNRAELKKVPVAYFVVCLTMKEDTPENRKLADGYSDPARAIVAPVDVGSFAGAVKYDKMGFAVKFLMKNMIKAPEGDFRNWEQIKAWAVQLLPRLKFPT